MVFPPELQLSRPDSIGGKENQKLKKKSRGESLITLSKTLFSEGGKTFGILYVKVSPSWRVAFPGRESFILNNRLQLETCSSQFRLKLMSSRRNGGDLIGSLK